MGNADESGNVTIAFAVLMTILLVLFVGVMDLGGAWATRQAMENDLAAAMDQRKTAADGMFAKNLAGDWILADGVVTSLRRDGFEGQVTVWVAEAPAGEVPENRRAIGVWAWTSATYEPMTLGRLMGEVGLAAQNGCALVPYSTGRAWRPYGGDTVRVRKFVAQSGSPDLEETRQDYADAPDQLKEQLDLAVAEANDDDS